MTLRRILWSLTASAALCGMVSATPPALSEGRELDPVARDFFLTTLPPAPAPVEAEEPGSLPPLSFLSNIREVILTSITIPLGTVRPAGGIR